MNKRYTNPYVIGFFLGLVLQKAAPVEKPKTSDSFKIVEDEGC